jgi:branched-chain amino acid transport system ATP-binding protein
MPPVADSAIIELQGLCAGYGEVQVLWGVDMTVRRGEITALIGSNGAGKTTLMRVLSGLITMQSGYYFADGKDVAGDTSAQLLAHGIVHVPEGRRLFGAMSVEDNLLMGAYSRKVNRAELSRDLDSVYVTFPKLRERRNQAAATLSGGEQQMCAIGRGLMSAPRLLMIDELSLGVECRGHVDPSGRAGRHHRARHLPFRLRHGHGPYRSNRPGRRIAGRSDHS